jgi:hypothetical protein
MKKTLLIITLLFSLFTFSQNSKIKFGFQAGLNYSNFRGYNIPSTFNQVYSESPAFAYLGGINVEYKIKERLSLKFELNYERKSQKADNNIEIREHFDDLPQTYKFTSKKNYDYLIIPVLLKYNFTAQNSFYVNGGPFLGYLLKSQITNNLNVPNFNSDDLDTTKDNKKVDFGLSFGLGKIIDLNNNKAINIELRENLGLSNTSNIDVWNGGNVKTNSVNLIVGLIFN